MKKVLFLVIILSIVSLSSADIVRVPQDILNIQTALNSCSAGDTVLVSSGIYYENIIWPSTPRICLISVSGRDSTIIDGGGMGSVIKLASITDTLTMICGFTIRHGNSSMDGGGIYCNLSSPIIMNNLIDSNVAVFGGGISCYNMANPIITGNIIRVNSVLSNGSGGGIFCGLSSSPVIDSNLISFNEAYVGGGILCRESSPTITKNEISHNNALNSGGGILCNLDSYPLIMKNLIEKNYGTGGAGGIGCYRNSSPEIRENTIINNETDLITGYGGGFDIYIGSSPHIVKNIIGYNKAAFGGGIDCYDSCNPVIDSNEIFSNTGDGIYAASNSKPVISYNNIFGNSHYGVHNTVASVVINAENNWWGDANGPYHPVTNPGGQGDTVSNYVDFTPYLLDSINIIVGIKYLQTVIPDDFVLYQNYPNPFNPKTFIRFDMNKPAFVKLTIYNILGSEIETLVNEKLSAGIYETEWDGSRFSSGVYFYRLETDNNLQVKKMILLK